MADHVHITPMSIARGTAAGHLGAVLSGNDTGAELLGIVIAFPGRLAKTAETTARVLSCTTLGRITAEVERMPLAELEGAVGQALPAARILNGRACPAESMFRLLLCLCRLLDAGNVLGPLEGMDA